MVDGVPARRRWRRRLGDPDPLRRRRRPRQRHRSAAPPCSRTTSASARRTIPSSCETIGRVTATEVAATGIRWNYAPVVAVPHDIRWGRTFEGYSEDAEIVASARRRVHPRAAATDGADCRRRPTSWRRRSTTSATAATDVGHVDDRRLHDRPGRHAASTRRSCGAATCRRTRPRSTAGARTIMVSFSSWNGHQDARQRLPPDRRAEGRARLRRVRRVGLGRASTRSPATTPSDIVTVDQRRHRHGHGAVRLPDRSSTGLTDGRRVAAR